MPDPSAPATSQRRAAVRGWGVWRGLAAALLLAAAALKAHQLWTVPGPTSGGFGGRGFLIATAAVEFALAGWFASGLWPRATRWLGAACFTAFAAVAAERVWSGAASCGCFGRVAVPPWVTLTLDVVMAGGFVLFRPKMGDTGRGAATGVTWRRWAVVVGGVVLSVAVAAALSQRAFVTLEAGADPSLLPEYDGVVLVEPEGWIGKRCPLLPFIDIGDRLAEGEWTVVLYSHDCEVCAAALPAYAARAGVGEAVALVSVPPHAPDGDTPEPYAVTLGRLTSTRDWFVETPTEISLRDSVVTEIRRPSP